MCSQEPSRVRRLFGAIAPRYDLANRVLSGGLDTLWRRYTARRVAARQPRCVLDLACGSGDLTLALQRHCAGAEITGADFCAPMLEQARAKGLVNLVEADALHLPFADRRFDAVTVAFGLRNMASHLGALREMRRVLQPGGHVWILDFSLPPAPLRGLYRYYLHALLPRLAGLLTGERAAYEYLGGSIEAFPSGAALCALLEEAGFCEPRAQRLTGGIVSLYTGRAK